MGFFYQYRPTFRTVKNNPETMLMEVPPEYQEYVKQMVEPMTGILCPEVLPDTKIRLTAESTVE
jgi:hypothetical protein